MTLSKPNSALIIIGHGSTLNPDSSAPTHQHADAIRVQGIFAEVVCAFWKEEPSMTEVFEMVESREIYIVPNFISEGYFCQQVLPRELRLTGPTTERDGRVIHYCDPVGIHPNMTLLLMQRADEIAPGIPRDQTSLIIVGHGTNLNENSTKAIQDQVKLIREGGYGFAEVLDAYMEEAPFVADWHKLTRTPNVIVVPFFIADGLHSFQDIPVLLGIESEVGAAASECEVFRQNPIAMHGRSLFYSSAIGTEAHMADVILDQVEDFDRKHGVRNQPLTPILSHEEGAGVRGRTVAALKRWLDAGLDTIGQVRITQNASGTFTLHHKDDTSVPSVPSGSSPFDAREIARYDEQGRFRPLKSAPTLKRGWLLELRTLDEVRLALDFLYPAALGMALEHERGTLSPVALREMLGRQTGMYRFARTIKDDAALEMIASNCDTATRCMRRILWDLAPNQPLTGNAAAKTKAGSNEAGTIPLLCMEACCHVLSESRRIAKAAHEAADQRADA
jgi:sirohydrochlorin cobaltochelatase